MGNDQFDVDVPDTIPAYITRRHQRSARRAVARSARGGLRAAWRRRATTLAAASAAIGLIVGIVMLWVVWPSPTTFVVVPAVVLVAGICAVTLMVVRKSGLDRIG
jgi:fatty acid desaturase